MALAFGHGADRHLGAGLQLFNDALDLLRRILGAMGKVAHLIRHDRETTTGFTCTCRFNGGVKRQQVGLLGNAADHLKYLANVHRVGIEGFDVAARVADFCR
ncbi:hypothetical protein D3C77_645900 [compost metagenome]